MGAVLPLPPDPDTTDHFVYLRGVPWEEYQRLLALRGESSTPRMTYLHGVLELMAPSKYHEGDKKKLARLLEAWAEEAGVELEGYGSWTLESHEHERGAEPDECYCVARIAESDDDRPDVAIEVVWTSGGIDKLEVYRKLGVREVWFYERGSLRFFALRGEAYEAIERSLVLPACDPSLLVHAMAEATQSAAVKALRAAMRRG
jgi:Uma2 family endonuclease